MPLGLWALIFAAGWVGIAVEWSFEHWPFVFAVIALWLLWRIAEGVKAKKECRRPVLAPPSVQW